MSILTKANPLATESWKLSNLMTSRALGRIGENGGPRCCKRDSYLSILAAIDFAQEHLNISMEKTIPTCSRFRQNNQCLGKHCPFFPGKKTE